MRISKNIILFLNQNNHQVDIIQSIKLRDILRNYKIIPFGEDLNEDFTNFISLSDDFWELIFINKFK